MSSVDASEARIHFSQLVERAERGEAITITRRGRLVARLVPVDPGHDVTAARAAADRLRALAREIRAGSADPLG